jgi:hypothetical protein
MMITIMYSLSDIARLGNNKDSIAIEIPYARLVIVGTCVNVVQHSVIASQITKEFSLIKNEIMA